ncbi:MAG: hypothetical protein RET84_23705, partial [Pseudomonadota bacterium]|nr:hypothetical protein [Pseudomonadota bacterium]
PRDRALPAPRRAPAPPRAATPRAATPRARIGRPVPQAAARAAMAVSSLDWLRSEGGNLLAADGATLRLLGLRLSPNADAAAIACADQLLAQVPQGRRCVALCLSLAAQLTPPALLRLDARIDAWAAQGIYTLLRLDARLWLHGHHLRLAQRHARRPAVMFGLLGRPPLAARLWAAARALQSLHPRALVWLPLESVAELPQARMQPGLGLLWDATRPQAPPAAALAGTLRQPLLLDGWQPLAQAPMAHERLMALCRQGNIGWLAHSAAGWFGPSRGVPVPTRAVHALQRAVHASTAGSAFS